MTSQLSGSSVPSERAKGVRQKLYRNRKLKYAPGSVQTDGSGNILSRPLTKRLECFADPVEWAWGQSDAPRIWGNKLPEPNGCAMCPVQVFCAQTAWERIQSCSELLSHYEAWQSSTARMDKNVRYSDSTWSDFVRHCEAKSWSDANITNLELDRSQAYRKRIAEGRLRSPHRRVKKKPKPRRVTQRVLKKIEEYRNARVREMISLKQDPNCPLWVRNRTKDRLTLIADAWQAREVLTHARKKSSARAVLEWLVDNDKLEQYPPASMAKRVGEALKRADQLIEDSIWPYFELEFKPIGVTGMHPSAVVEVLDS